MQYVLMMMMVCRIVNRVDDDDDDDYVAHFTLYLIEVPLQRRRKWSSHRSDRRNGVGVWTLI